MGLYEARKTSEKLETEGVWADLGNGERAKVARAGPTNRVFTTALEKLQREHGRAMGQWDIPTNRRYLIKLYADIMVKDWLRADPDGNLDEGGAEIRMPDYVGERYKREMSASDGGVMPFTKENVLRIFSDIDTVFDDVKAVAEMPQAFLQSNLDGITKN